MQPEFGTVLDTKFKFGNFTAQIPILNAVSKYTKKPEGKSRFDCWEAPYLGSDYDLRA